MSWDVNLIKSATNDESDPDEIENPLPIATKAEVREWLRQKYPGMDSIDGDWPMVFEEEYSVEFMLDDEDEQQNEIMLIIRGDEAPYDLIEEMCHAFGCRAVDMGTGGFLEGRETSSFEQWKDFRDQVKEEYETASEGGLRGLWRSIRDWITGR